jgi:hypothetical protein
MININNKQMDELFTRVGEHLLDNYSHRNMPIDRE